MDVALNVLTKPDSKIRPNLRSLEGGPQDDNFRQLQHFLKNLEIKVKTERPGRKRKIMRLIPWAGTYEFDKDGTSTTIAVRTAVPDTLALLTNVSYSNTTGKPTESRCSRRKPSVSVPPL
jgi:hypothetical protein